MGSHFVIRCERPHAYQQISFPYDMFQQTRCLRNASVKAGWLTCTFLLQNTSIYGGPVGTYLLASSTSWEGSTRHPESQGTPLRGVRTGREVTVGTVHKSIKNSIRTNRERECLPCKSISDHHKHSYMKLNGNMIFQKVKHQFRQQFIHLVNLMICFVKDEMNSWIDIGLVRNLSKFCWQLTESSMVKSSDQDP